MTPVREGIIDHLATSHMNVESPLLTLARPLARPRFKARNGRYTSFKRVRPTLVVSRSGLKIGNRAKHYPGARESTSTHAPKTDVRVCRSKLQALVSCPAHLVMAGMSRKSDPHLLRARLLARGHLVKVSVVCNRARSVFYK